MTSPAPHQPCRVRPGSIPSRPVLAYIPILAPASRRAATLLACALVACGLLCCAAKAVGPMRLVFSPVPDRDAMAWRDRLPVQVESAGVASVRSPAFTVSLRLVDGEERRRFVRDALGRDADLFSDSPPLRPFVTILMEVRNASPDTLIFNPQQIVLVTDRPDYLEPLDATRAYEELRAAGRRPEEFLDDIHRVIFDTAQTLGPGQSVARLLAYPSPVAEVRLARLEVASFAVGTATFSFDVPMRQVPADLPAGPSSTPGAVEEEKGREKGER